MNLAGLSPGFCFVDVVVYARDRVRETTDENIREE